MEYGKRDKWSRSLHTNTVIIFNINTNNNNIQYVSTCKARFNRESLTSISHLF